MAFGISPGVYPVETDKSVIVPSVSTTAAAIVIQSDKGPSNVPTLITSNKEFIDTFGKPLPDRPSMYSALAFLEKGNRLYVARAIVDAARASITASDTQATPAATLGFNAASEGAWGNDISISFNDKDATDDIFEIIVSYQTVEVERWRVSKTSNLLDGYGKSLFVEDVINGNSDYITVTSLPASTELPDMTQSLDLVGGTNDTTALADADVTTAWSLFANKRAIDVTLLINGGFATETVQMAMINLAEARADAIAILDVPEDSNAATDAATYSDTTLNANSSFAALYAGWPQIYDQYNDKTLYAPPSGYVAAVMAFTATVSEPWSAPAGTTRGGLNVLGVNEIYTEGDRDVLYESNVNPIQSDIGLGVYIDGQKTLSRAPSALDRINVRMLLIVIQKAITRALKPFVFEANDPFTRENIFSLVSNYMNNILARRGVYEFKVVCDETNNTAQVIDQNKLLCDLFVKPTRTAEFIKLNTIVTATGVDFK